MNKKNLRDACRMRRVTLGVETMKSRIAITILIFGASLVLQAHAAGPTVSEGYELDLLLDPLPSGFVHQIEAVYNPAYRGDVVIAVAGRDGFKVSTVDDGGMTTLATIGPFPPGAELLTLRFDRAGSFGKLLFAGVFHSNGDQPFNYQTDIVLIEPDGSFRIIASFGTKFSPMAMHFDTTRFNSQFPDGMYLLDGDSADGAAMYHLLPDGTSTPLAADLRPSGRSDLDPRGFEFAPTDQYGRFPTLADSDDDDGLSVIYQWKGDLTVGELVAPVAIGTREFGDLAFSAGGDFDDMLYITDSRNKKVQRVSFRGQLADFATGFNGVQSISIGRDQMFVSDADGIYRITEEEIIIPPTTVVLGARVVTTGVGTDDATDSRVVVGQLATGSMSNGITIMHAGWIPSLYGAALAPIYADFDGDRIVDLGDYSEMNACIDGPDMDAGASCSRGDSDSDGDVDLRDVSEFLQAFTESAP